MRRSVSIQGSILTLFLGGVLAACGSSSGGGSKTTPPPVVTSVSVTPNPVTVFTGTTQQFTASVVGSAGISTAVTWSVTGDGTISESGLFTAGSTPGPATVMAASQEDPSVTGPAAVTVSYQPVAWGNWYGTLVSSDGTQTLPMDFSLTRKGSNLTSNTLVVVLGTTNASVTTCTNLILSVVEQSASPFTAAPNLSGTISAQSVSLSFALDNPSVATPIALTGTLSPDGSTISGTFSKTAYGCFANVTSGSFSFMQYPTLNGTYAGTFAYGTDSVPFSTINGANITVGPIAATNCPAATYPMLHEQEGRVFHMSAESLDVNPTSLVVWGILNDTAGQTLDTFVVSQGGIVNPCFDPPSPLETTLTAQ